MNIDVASLKDSCVCNYWRASVASETVLGVDNAKSGICYWRASVASETLTGVKMKKSGMFIQRASEASEADSQSCSIEISDIQYILVMCLSTNGERA